MIDNDIYVFSSANLAEIRPLGLNTVKNIYKIVLNRIGVPESLVSIYTLSCEYSNYWVDSSELESAVKTYNGAKSTP